MAAAIDRFLEDPTRARLAGARRAWLAARDDYIVTEPFRFYGGPIDDPKTGPEGLINAWPMDEAYVDYVRGDPRAGIVNDRRTYPQITADVIVEANEKGGETNISSGWHAIEFLLWGQDRSARGPGARPASDYATAPNAARRATYLRLSTDRLLSDLRSVRAPWAPRGGAYRATFLADPDRALTNILRGVGALNSGELAGERMAVALESKDQEDEHSCFSDNTNADVVNDLKGIRMVYMGAPSGAAGTSLDALLTEVDPQLARTLRAKLDATLAKAQAFPVTFERMIAAPSGSTENKALADVLASIEAQGADLAKAAKALGVKVNFEV
jgi:putative iron-regulated protein